MNKRLIDHLRQNGFVDEVQLRAALARQQQFGGDVIDLLLRMKVLSERDCARGLATFYRYPLVDLNQTTPEDEALGLLDGEYARAHGILPLRVDHDMRMLDVAVFDPSRSLDALDFVRRRAGLEPRPHITPPTALNQAVSYFYFGDLPESSSGASISPEPGSTSGSRALLGESLGRGSGSGGFKKASPPRAAFRSNRLRSASGRFEPPDSGFGADASDGFLSGDGIGLGAMAAPLERAGHDRGALDRSGSFDQIPLGGLPVGSPSSSGGGADEALREEFYELVAKVERLEEMLEHERRVTQMLVEVMSETGLVSRDELLKRMREGS